MNVKEYLLVCASEESCEISQAFSKANRFGMDDKNPNTNLSAAQQIALEINDLMAVIEMLEEYDVYIPGIGNREAIDAKKQKLEDYMDYSIDRGVVR